MKKYSIPHTKYSKQSRRLLVLTATLPLLAVLVPLAYYSLSRAPKTEASWFDDTYAYRQQLTFGNTGGADSNKKVKFDVDTAALTTDKLQADCDDVRFTDLNGRVLRYYLDSAGGACDTGSTDYYVLLSTIPTGENAIYMYYGNPTATASRQATQFAEATFSPTSGPSFSSEEKGLGPVLAMSFNESGGTTINDSSSNRHTGTLNNNNSNTIWLPEDQCVSGSCLRFDGNGDYISVPDAASLDFTGDFSFSTWVKVRNGTLSSTLFDKMTGANVGYRFMFWEGKPNLMLNAGDHLGNTVITAHDWMQVTGVRSGTTFYYYFNGVLVDTLTSLFSNTANSDALRIGGSDTEGYDGAYDLDEFKLYNYALSAEQVKSNYSRLGDSATAAQIGGGSQTSLSSGMIGYWKMDESSGSTVADGSSNGNAGTATDNSVGNGDGNTPPAVIGGKFGTARDWDGTDDYVTIADPGTGSVFDVTSKITLAAWIYPDSLSGSAEIINKKADGTASGYRLRRNTSTISFAFSDGVTTQFTVTSGSVLTASTWQHVAATYDGSTVRLFHNGRQVYEEARTETIASNNSAVVIGGYINLSAYWWDGRIDEARIYNKALSTSEVQRLYSWAPGPIGYWNMDETSTSEIYDTSGTGTPNFVLNSPGTKVNGKFGKGIRNPDKSDVLFDSDSTNYRIPTTGSVTYSAWVYFEEGANFSNDATIIGRNNCCGSSAFTVSVNASEILELNMTDDAASGNSTYTVTGTTVLQPNQWYHVTGVLDRFSETNTTVYLNGIQESVSRTGTFASIGSFNDDPYMAIMSGYYGMIGVVDEFRIYNYARSQQQIIEDMNGGHPLGGSPVGSQAIYWPLDEMTGTTANNAIQNGTNGTLTSIASPATSSSGWTRSGRINSALTFDGSDDKVVIATASDSSVDFAGAESFSICSYVYPTTMPGASERDLIAGKWDATSSLRGYRLTLTNDDADSTGNFRAEIYDESADQTISAAGANDTVSTNTWYHVCMTSNGGTAGAAGDVRLYVNGQNTASNTLNASFLGLEDVAADFTVGDYDATDVVAADTAFTGVIDEVQVYTALLSDEGVRIVMNAGGSQSAGVLGASEASRGNDGAGNPPIAYWNLDEKTGTTINDKSGNAYSATLSGGTWSTGKLGAAVDFNQSYASTASTSVFDGSGAFTISFWMYPKTTGEGGFGTVLTKESVLNIYLNGTTLEACQDTNCLAAITSTSSSAYSLNTWTHISLVHNGSGTYTWYSNGVNRTSDSSGPDTNTTGVVVLGAENAGASSFNFDGKIDEVKIYNYARTSAQAAYDYNRGAPIGHWQLDDCQGTSARDASGNGNHGTIAIGAGGTENTLGTCTTASTAWQAGATGKINSALGLDGADDTVNIGNASLLSFERTQPISISAWFQTTSDSGMTIIGKQDDSSPYSGWNLQTGGGGLLYFQLVNDYGSNFIEVRSTNDLNYSDGAWHHFVATYDGSSSATGVRLYFDGRLIEDTDTGDNLTSSIVNGIDVHIGSRNGAVQFFAGLLDDIRIYPYVLSLEEVQRVRNDNAALRFGPLTGSP